MSFILIMSLPAMGQDYQSGAQALFKYGFIVGGDGGDLMVDSPLTRAQASKLLADMYGKSTEAASFQYQPIFKDVTSKDWFARYVGYAQKNGWVAGYPDGTFNPNASISTQEWATMLIASLGYEYTWNTVIQDILSLGIVVSAENPKRMLRGEAFEAMWKAVNTNRMGQTITLGQEVGKLEMPKEPEPPKDAVIDTIERYSLKEVVLVSSVPLKADTVTSPENYKVTSSYVHDLKVVEVQYNSSTQKILLIFNQPVPQQTDITLSVTGVMSEGGLVLRNEKFATLEMVDLIPPTIKSAVAIGTRTIKVQFSEPMKSIQEQQSYLQLDEIPLLSSGEFTINKGNIAIKSVELQNNNREALIETYTDLTPTVTLESKNTLIDYAGFTVVQNPIQLTVVKDVQAPYIVGYENISATGVTLVWSEDIRILNGLPTQYYHSSSTYMVDQTVTSKHVDGNKLRLDFTRNFIPSGKTLAVVMANAVTDYSNNKNTIQQIGIELEKDTTAPYVVGNATPVSEQKVKLVFSEHLNNREGQVQSRQNYKLLDSNSADISYKIGSIQYQLATQTVEVNFSEPLIGNYSLQINNLSDYSGNPLQSNYYSFEMKDFTAPIASNWTARLYDSRKSSQMLKIRFDEPMAIEGKYSVLDVEKYSINGIALDTLDQSLLRMEMVDNNTSLEIYYPGAVVRGGTDFYADSNKTKETQDDLVIARVADANNNYISSFSVIVDIESKGALIIESASLIERDVVELIISDALVQISTADFKIEGNGEVYGVASYDLSYLENRKSRLVLKLNKDVVGSTESVTVKVIAEGSMNRYGETLDMAAAPIALKDSMPPFVAKASFDGIMLDNITYTRSTGIVNIRFNENIDPRTVSLLSFSVANYMVEDISVQGTDIRIRISSEDRDKVQRYDSVFQNVEVRDMSGNGVKSMLLQIQKVY
jgi:hypothetical protein